MTEVNEKENIKAQNVDIANVELHASINVSPKSTKKILLITLGVSFLVIAVICAITIPLVLKNKEETPVQEDIAPEEELLIIQIKRELNEVSRYRQISRSQISMEMKDHPKVMNK